MANIREVDAIVHVVRCFEDDNVNHVDGSVDPVRDKEIIDLELIFKDIEKLKGKLSSSDQSTIEDALREGQSFLDENPEAEKEQYDEKRKEVEGICDPIIQKGMGIQDRDWYREAHRQREQQTVRFGKAKVDYEKRHSVHQCSQTTTAF